MNLKAHTYISTLNLLVTRDKYGNLDGLVKLNAFSIGRATRGFKCEDTIVVPVGSGHTEITKYSFAPFTKEMVSIQFKDKSDREIASDYGVKVIYAGRKTIACIYNVELDIWRDITNNKKYTEEELTAYSEKIGEDLRLHKCFDYSPSDIRKYSYAAMDVTTEDTREQYINDFSNGAWDMVKEEVNEMIKNGVSKEKIQLFILKTMPRFGQLKAGSSNLGEIQSWAYYNGNFSTFSGETIDGT